jgi:hypothetical protein
VGQERWDKSASTHCAPRSTPLRPPLRHNHPLPAPSRLLPPDLALKGPTSITGMTEYGITHEETSSRSLVVTDVRSPRYQQRCTFSFMVISCFAAACPSGPEHEPLNHRMGGICSLCVVDSTRPLFHVTPRLGCHSHSASALKK